MNKNKKIITTIVGVSTLTTGIATAAVAQACQNDPAPTDSNIEEIVMMVNSLSNYSTTTNPTGLAADIIMQLQSTVNEGGNYVISTLGFSNITTSDVVPQDNDSIYIATVAGVTGTGYIGDPSTNSVISGDMIVEFSFSNDTLAVTAAGSGLSISPSAAVLQEITNTFTELSNGYDSSRRGGLNSNSLAFLVALETITGEGEVVEIYPFDTATANLNVSVAIDGSFVISLGTDGANVSNSINVVFANTGMNSGNIPHVWSNTSMLPLTMSGITIGEESGDILFGAVSNFSGNETTTTGLDVLFSLRNATSPGSVSPIITAALVEALANGSGNLANFVISGWSADTIAPGVVTINPDGTQITLLGNGTDDNLLFVFEGTNMNSTQDVIFTFTYGTNNEITDALVTGTFEEG